MLTIKSIKSSLSMLTKLGPIKIKKGLKEGTFLISMLPGQRQSITQRNQTQGCH